VEHTTGVNLAKNVREWTLKKKYSELLPLNGKVCQPVIDSQGKPVNGYAEWTQNLVVHACDPDRVTLDVSGTPVALRCTVLVTRNKKPVTSMSWYAFDGTP
jgi:hypothetical protein